MVALLERDLSLPEAAFLADVSERVINQEIEANVVKPRNDRAQRCLSTEDVIYLTWVRGVRSDMTPKLRRRCRTAIAEAIEDKRDSAEVEAFQVRLKEVVGRVRAKVRQLEATRRQFIEQRPEVLGGTPVIKGTRIPVHLVADQVKCGMPRDELGDELDLRPEQIDAAILFSRIYPKRGRPRHRRTRVIEHVPAD